MNETINPPWRTQFHVSRRDTSRTAYIAEGVIVPPQYELSIVRDNAGDAGGWGWAGMKKIIVFGTGVGQGEFHPMKSEDDMDRAKAFVQSLCDLMNRHNLKP